MSYAFKARIPMVPFQFCEVIKALSIQKIRFCVIVALQIFLEKSRLDEKHQDISEVIDHLLKTVEEKHKSINPTFRTLDVVCLKDKNDSHPCSALMQVFESMANHILNIFSELKNTSNTKQELEFFLAQVAMILVKMNKLENVHGKTIVEEMNSAMNSLIDIWWPRCFAHFSGSKTEQIIL